VFNSIHFHQCLLSSTLLNSIYVLILIHVLQFFYVIKFIHIIKVLQHLYEFVSSLWSITYRGSFSTMSNFIRWPKCINMVQFIHEHNPINHQVFFPMVSSIHMTNYNGELHSWKYFLILARYNSFSKMYHTFIEHLRFVCIVTCHSHVCPMHLCGELHPFDTAFVYSFYSTSPCAFFSRKLKLFSLFSTKVGFAPPTTAQEHFQLGLVWTSTQVHPIIEL
jgi:hypothetical protein